MKRFYRPEIDGLRAIAVLGVIFYHAEIIFNGNQIISGGFLGVDIFFVISGYLITSIIIDEYKETKNFSYTNFYVRRAKRLMPALLVVIFFTTFLAYIYLLPAQYEEYYKSIISSIFFTSNFFFHYSGQEYGENILSSAPLLHTWSLGIEEQFYILYPIVLIFILKFFKKDIKSLFVIGILSSISFTVIVGVDHQSFNFYMLPSRIWELLCGGIIVIWKRGNVNLFFSKYEKFLSTLGLLLILFSFVYFNDVNKHPSYYTILPVLGCSILLMNNKSSNYINSILSISMLRKIGLISYSLYLWHHPVLSFGKITGITGLDNENLFVKILLILLSIIVASISFNFVEKIFRKKMNIPIKKIIVGFSIGCLFIVVFPYTLKNLQEKKFPSIVSELHKKTWFETKQNFKSCFQRKEYFCSFNRNGKEPVFLVGDSILASIQEELKDSLIRKDYNFIPMTNAGCDFLDIDLKKQKNIFCNNEIYKQRKKVILNKKNGIIILHINYKNSISFKDEKTQKKLQKDLMNFLNLGYKVIFIYPIPQMNVNISKTISKKFCLNKKKFIESLNNKNEFINIDYNSFKKDSFIIDNFLDNINHSNFYKIYPDRFFCNTELKNKCIAHNNKDLYFIDNAHLSNSGSLFIANEIMKLIN